MGIYEAYPLCKGPSLWGVDDEIDGVKHKARFFGPDAEVRAREYASWKNRNYRVAAELDALYDAGNGLVHTASTSTGDV